MARKLHVDIAFYLLFALFVLLLFLPHEFAHYAAYRAFGIRVHMTLNTASPADPSQRRALAELAGPGMNLLIATVALALFRRIEQGSRVWAALALASAMTRLVIYVLVLAAAAVTGSTLGMGNDEPTAASLFGLPSLTFVAVFAPLFVAIVWFSLREFQGTWIQKVGHVGVLGILVLGLGLLVGNVLDPWLFPAR